MNRLTKRLEDGQAIFHECHGTCGTCDGANCYCIGPMVDRLAAYEDTGLKPEDLKKTFNEDAILKLAAQALNTTPDHLRDIIKADQDGRLVALPCKVGDVIRFVSEDKQGYTRYEVISFNVDPGETFIVASCKPGSARLFSVNDIGKTVFLTREEAEASLKGGD